MKPEISIIIPTLNEEKYIEKTLRQFLPFKKKYNLELIVSDGNSKDNTVKIARKYADKVISYREKNISNARNAGAKIAKGKILLFFDADIRISNLKVFFDTIIEKFKDKSIIAATTPIYVYPEEENLSDKFFHFMFNIIIKGSGECQIIKKSIFKKVKGYNEELAAGEDVELLWRLKQRGKVLYLTNLKVYKSPRRFRKLGYLKTIFLWILNSISAKLFKKSFSKEWKQVR